MKLLKELYVYAPTILKRIVANIEAVRRDYYRQADKAYYDLIGNLVQYNPKQMISKYNELINYVNRYVPFYEKNNIINLQKREDIAKLPILEKQDVRKNYIQLKSSEAKFSKDLWKGTTSGSTGSPLIFLKDRETLKFERNSYNEFYKYLGCHETDIKVRFSGINIIPHTQKKPPYYLYIDKYKQLQGSVYHISNDTYKHYLEEFDKRKVKYGTGFPSAWTALAEIMLENGVTYNGLKVIITDSEGISRENKSIIEKAFNCKVYRTYGLGEVGMCAIECEKGNYHSLPTHYVETVNEEGEPQEDGVEGQLLVTDFNSKMSPYIRYSTGDLGIMDHTICGCDFKTPKITRIIGRIEDYVLTKDGRKVTRLSKVLSVGIGIKKSQIIQMSLENILIKIIPDENFQEESMKSVVKEVKKVIGDVKVDWEIVEKLEMTTSGKIKFLIRRI